MDAPLGRKMELLFRRRRPNTCLLTLPRRVDACLRMSAHGTPVECLVLPQQRAADGSIVRCMLVADVAAGNTFLTYEKNFPELTEPPSGYHSIVGEARTLMIILPGSGKSVCQDALPTIARLRVAHVLRVLLFREERTTCRGTFATCATMSGDFFFT